MSKKMMHWLCSYGYLMIVTTCFALVYQGSTAYAGLAVQSITTECAPRQCFVIVQPLISSEGSLRKYINVATARLYAADTNRTITALVTFRQPVSANALAAMIGTDINSCASARWISPSNEDQLLRFPFSQDEAEAISSSLLSESRTEGFVSCKVTLRVEQLRQLTCYDKVLCVDPGPIDQLAGLKNPTIVFAGDLYRDCLELTGDNVDYDLPGEGANVQRIPTDYSLSANYPNPFNPSTTIRYVLPEAAKVRLTVYNVAGRPIRVLVDRHESAGYKLATWDGKNDQGVAVASGIYFCKLESPGFSQVQRMLLLK